MGKQGRLDSGEGRKVYYPRLLICTETPDVFFAELVGVQDEYTGLTLKRRAQDSAQLYVNQLPMPEGRPLINLNAAGNELLGLSLGYKVDREALRKRFPVVDLFPTSINIKDQEGLGAVLQFGGAFESAQLNNCVVINRIESIFRARHTLSLTMVSWGLSPLKYREFLNDMVAGNEVNGVHSVDPSKEKDYAVTGQFQSLYLGYGMHETTIGEFLNQHPDILLRSFSARRHVYEPYLEWVENGGRENEKAINPDLILERLDGGFDIYDLKTAALAKSSITKGKHRRRRFIDYVEEGIAQLANYREYFSFANNRAHANEKYKIDVQNPQLSLVVGNFDNADPEEIREASRRLNGITVVDYDTVTQLFLAASA